MDQNPTFDPIPPAAPAAVPAPDPNLDARINEWKAAFSEIRNDPALQWGLLRLGTNLMQPPKPGEGQAGLVGRSIQDAMDYTTQRQIQAQKQATDMESLSLKGREVSAHERESAERTTASQQQRGITAANAPIQHAQAVHAFQKAQSDLDLIRNEEAAGNRSPEFLKRKAAAEIALKEAHANLYNAYANAMPSKNTKQTQSMRPVENADGTTSFVSSVLVNGEQYFHTYTPPRFTNIDAARAQATKDVDKITPSSWNPFAGAAPYAGTREQEIERRAQEYMKPQVGVLGPRGPMTGDEYNRLGGQAPVSPTPAPNPRVETPSPATPGPTPMPPAFPRESQQQAQQAAERSLGIIRMELRDARQNRADPASIAALEREEANAMAKMRGAATTHPPVVAAPPAPQRTVFTRDASGNVVPVGRPAPTPPSAPAAAAPTEASGPELSGQILEKARAALVEARRQLMSYGVRQQRSDPEGYRNALLRVKQYQDAVAQAQDQWEKEALPGLPAVTGRTYK
jgi:hypothetical protein